MYQEMVEEIENVANDIVNGIHTAIPSTVISFNPSDCSVTVKPVGKFITKDGKRLDYPVISNVPVVFPYSQSAGVGIAFPIAKGDSCLIIAAEIELDEWRSGAEAEGNLKFDLTNAIAIPGLIKGANPFISGVAGGGEVVLSAGGNRLSVSKAGITVVGNLNVKGNISYSGGLSGG